MAKSPRICIIGAGAIGGVTAALLRNSGHDVTLVTKHQNVADMANKKGIKLSGVRGNMQVKLPAVATVPELTGTFDACIIATKTYDMPQAAEAMLPFLKEDSLVFSFQNGICTDALAKVVGANRAVGCVVGFGSTMSAPGTYDMTSEGDFIIGRVQGDNAALLPMQQALNHVVPTHVSDNIYAELYSKLIINACITSLGAVSGLLLGDMLKRRDARNIFLRIMKEATLVAEKMGLKIPPYGGRLDYHQLMAGKGPMAYFTRHGTVFAVGLKYKRLKSSSLQSLMRGKPTEVDAFNGYIAEKGREVGVPCPVNQRLTDMVHEIEQGKRKITPENLKDAGLKGK